jgi:hypothetical protein
VSAPGKVAKCRSCGAGVFWAITAGGKLNPVDAEPVPTGNLVLSISPDKDVLQAASFDGAKHAGRRRFVSHFSTCPNSTAHRLRGART